MIIAKIVEECTRKYDKMRGRCWESVKNCLYVAFSEVNNYLYFEELYAQTHFQITVVVPTKQKHLFMDLGGNKS